MKAAVLQQRGRDGLFVREAPMPVRRDGEVLLRVHAAGLNRVDLYMRDNGSGSPGTIALLISYLFDQPSLPLFDIIPRSGDVETYSTEPASAGIERNGARPIWVLTSPRTFSDGEGLAFLLQERQRAQVVGEKTAGAANPGKPYPVNDVFEVTVPNGHIRSAIKHSNWEGDGVTPDVSAPATSALDIALARARQDLQQRKTP